MKLKLIALLLIAVVATLPGIAKAAPFDELLDTVPAGANTLVLIDVNATLSSPVAQEKGWGKRLEVNNVDRPIYLPPEANKLVLAAALRSNDDFTRLWELAAMELEVPLAIRSIARSEGGYVDSINGYPAAWTPSDAYFITLSDRMLGVMFPAERQFVSRWVDFIQRNQEQQISGYLAAASKLSSSKVPIVMAIDLKDVVNPHELDTRLMNSPLAKKSGLSVAELSDILVSVQGATLRVAVGKDVQGQLRIDFGKSVAPIEAIAKDMVLNALENMGAHIEDLVKWKLELEDKAITMRGRLSEDGQRRIFSVVEIPSTKFSTLKDEQREGSGETPESKMRESSLTYYRATDVLIKDLRRDLRGNKASSAVMERYARKIDRMPILNVDNDLLDYGSQLADTLRAMALSKRQGGIQAGVQTTGMAQGRTGGSSYSGYNQSYVGRLFGPEPDLLYASKQSAAQRSSIKAGAMAESKNMRVEGFKLIDENSAAIRRTMTQKYGVEF